MEAWTAKDGIPNYIGALFFFWLEGGSKHQVLSYTQYYKGASFWFASLLIPCILQY
jgi:hypothetical protein